jgi:hypothetical protein
MLLGKPVIATGYSGNLDFMTTFNSRLVDWQPKPIAISRGPYRAGQVWAEPDLEHATSCLRQMFFDHELRTRLGQRAKLETLATLHPDMIGQRITARLKLIETQQRPLQMPDSAQMHQGDGHEKRLEQAGHEITFHSSCFSQDDLILAPRSKPAPVAQTAR